MIFDGQSSSIDRDRFWRAAGVAAFVTVVGPLLGSLIYAALILPSIHFVAAPPIAMIREALSLLATILMFAYMFGGLSALLSGLAVGRDVYVAERAIGYMRAIKTAVIATLCAFVIVDIVFTLGSPRRPPTMLAVLIPPAIVAAVGCLFLMRRIGLIKLPFASF